MYRLIHLSDLHFGTTNSKQEGILLEQINQLDCQLVVITGDSTQRNKLSEFEAAIDFFKKIRHPLVIIPGNHDIHYYSWKRFYNPLERYNALISPRYSNEYHQDKLHLFHLNSVNQYRFFRGDISSLQIKKMLNRAAELPDDHLCLALTHHPGIIERKFKRLPTSLTQKISLVLSGHSHFPSAQLRQKTVFVTCGTSLSSRLRNHSNSFNLITVKAKTITVELWSFQETSQTYLPSTTCHFQLSP